MAGPSLESLSDRFKSWKLTDHVITDPSQCRSRRLDDMLPASKILRLTYTNSGIALLALCSNAVHKLWKWQRSESNMSGKATASYPAKLWHPGSGMLMTNDISDNSSNLEEGLPCIALSKNDSYVISGSGGKVSLFNMMTFKVMTRIIPPPPAATFLAFHPQDNNIIAVGMEDSTILIYNFRFNELRKKLNGHQKRITGLAFSNALNVLVSSGADTQLCVWGSDDWEKRKTKLIQTQPSHAPAPTAVADTRVQFHKDQIRLLVVHETQLAIYDGAELERLRYWTPGDGFTASISDATYSCDCQLVYAAFVDGSIGVFDAESLQPRCRLAASVYIAPGVSGSSATAYNYPLVIAAHPSERHQFALGLSDGGVQVIEPLESEGKWGI